jgi:hypothetical protein
MDDLTKDVEVFAVKAIMLACAVRLRHGHIETQLRENVAGLEKVESVLKKQNRALSKQVELLQATIEKNRKVVEHTEQCLHHNIDLRSREMRSLRRLRSFVKRQQPWRRPGLRNWRNQRLLRWIV